MSVNKTELIDAIAATADLPKASAGRALDAVVDSPESVESVSRSGATLRCHLKVDTGMGRLGFPAKAAAEILLRMSRIRCVKPDIRLMTHLEVQQLIQRNVLLVDGQVQQQDLVRT